MKPNSSIRFDFNIKYKFRIRFEFSIKPVSKETLSVQLYSRQGDEEISGQVYHQHQMPHIVNPMASV